MKKKLIVSVLVVTNFLFVGFSIIQKMEADKQRQLAMQYREQAEQLRILAEQARMEAQQAHVSFVRALKEAEFQRQVVEQQLTRSQKQSR